ncbi:MAG TPA: L-glutamate gamma-semialdehyde dehydrogenase [Gemmatimonadales bacterium]|nr:L-glutamate gamma-semialdehyde dehydrogenase [Gemmatimonadales bacterium]HRZ08332.1 L-glutamate gamma-semialdehyde dehydrogenase [Gemmatimonadales bacterium]
MSAYRTPAPRNEPVLNYAPGSPERAALKAALARMSAETIEIPVVIGGQEFRTGRTINVVAPHDHRRVLAKAHLADPALIAKAVDSATAAQHDWAAMPFADRAAVFLKAADLLAGPWRQVVNAATMLGQSKTAYQAEIDSACELIDFFRLNVHFAERLYEEQPFSSPGIWNRMDHRPLEGFVYAITPFNFTAIGGNLPTTPAILGNVAVWKPAASALLSNWYVYKLLEAAGLPPGVINFVPGSAAQVSDLLLADRRLAGIHFTGSTEVFQSLWRTVGQNLPAYAGYPRLVGETGGKDFVLAHQSADVDALAVALVRGAFEYQGQKCSAASRAYVPDNLWPAVRERVVAMMADIRMGDVADFRNFVGAVIDKKGFDKISEYIQTARKAKGVELVAGGKADDAVGYFIEPTLLRAEDPRYRTMCEEIFGPVLTLHVYPAARWEETLALVDGTSPYALTGAVFAQDRRVLAQATDALRNAAGNFYLNDKPTGAVVGQQPFGGARASGTNDKAGSILNLMRWISPRSIKETFVPPVAYRYPFMDAE